MVSAVCGTIEVIALLDAAGPFFSPLGEAFPGARAGDWAAAQELDPDAFGPDGSWQLAFRCFALRRPGGRVTLVDAGAGPVSSPAARWAPVPGRLPQVLARAGIDPDDVDTVVLTHLHEDHVGWVVGEDGLPMFARASYLVQEAELAEVRRAGDAATWEYAVRPLLDSGQLEALSGRTRLAGGAAGSGDTVTAWPTPGHTIGHQSVLVSSDDQQVLIAGDALVHAVQLVDPGLGYRFESDQARAADTRRRLLEHGADRTLLATAHLGRPFIAV